MLNARERYTVKQLADLAGVSARTLHYYDQIGLLRPEAYGENGYRYYGGGDLLRLQQILFFRELDFSLAEIQSALSRPDFDLLRALAQHRQALHGRIQRLERLVETIDKTIHHLKGEIPMSNQDLYAGFDEEKQKEYEEIVREKWGDEPLNTSVKRWASLSPAEKRELLERGNRLHQQLAAAMDQGPASPAAQDLIAQYRQHLNFFYDISLEHYERLGHMYNANPDFQANYDAVRPGLAAFMEQAIVIYVKGQS